jgi:hypothetical protein
LKIGNVGNENIFKISILIYRKEKKIENCCSEISEKQTKF